MDHGVRARAELLEIQAHIARVRDRPAFAHVTAADAELAAAHEPVAKATR